MYTSVPKLTAGSGRPSYISKLKLIPLYLSASYILSRLSGMFRMSRDFLAKGQDWNPAQWEWNERERGEPAVGKIPDKKNNFVTSLLIPRRGQWNVDNLVVEKTELFRKFSEEQTSNQVFF